MTWLAYDPARLDSLLIAMSWALDDLQHLRSGDEATAVAMQTVRSASRTLGEYWLPRVGDVLNSTAMTSSVGTTTGSADFCVRPPNTPPGVSGWQIVPDPEDVGTDSSSSGAPTYGPDAPGSRSFGEVLEGILSGTVAPMPAPVDANGRAGAHYTSIAISGGSPREVGHTDLTSGVDKFADFVSDGLPIAWRETKELRIIYLDDALVTSSVHVLGAYDRDAGPETLTDQTTEATVSGYLVVTQESSVAQVNVQIGPGIQDPTESFPIISESSSGYSGVFYPDSPAEFQPTTDEPRFVSPPTWTFTTSASPMVDGWGTWKV